MAYTILVAEDSPTQAERIRLLLEAGGYQVVLVADGQEGLEKVRVTPPDLIISDVMMPKMDGYAFCRAVKSAEATRRVPFVLLTERNTPLDIIEGLMGGADNFITKPYQNDHLLERVRRIFETLSLRAQQSLDMELNLRMSGRNILITADKQQIFELLFSTFEELGQVNASLREHERELEARTRELAEANRLLQTASRRKSEFLANMSHELRTPLNSILGFAQILLEQTGTTLSPKQTRFLTNIFNSGQHLLQLINDILDLSKVEAGKFVLLPEPLPVAETLEDILVIARGLANKKGQIITTAIATDLSSLHADPVRFKQILFNLLSNAVKFTPNGGKITVTARCICDFRSPISDLPDKSQIGNQKSKMLEIAVNDSGIGIRAEDLSRLFQEFVQLEATASQHHEGTGLGLALTRRLVELHGGQIRASSEGAGCGATFTVLLPLSGPTADRG